LSDLFVAVGTGVKLERWYRNNLIYQTVPEKLMIFDAEANIRILKEFLSLFSENDFVLGETFSFFTARYQ